MLLLSPYQQSTQEKQIKARQEKTKTKTRKEKEENQRINDLYSNEIFVKKKN